MNQTVGFIVGFIPHLQLYGLSRNPWLSSLWLKFVQGKFRKTRDIPTSGPWLNHGPWISIFLQTISGFSKPILAWLEQSGNLNPRAEYTAETKPKS
jgi:hypothetical protein